MSGPDDLPPGGTEMAKHWYLDLSTSAYEQEDNFLADNGQIHGQLNSAFNFSHEPEEVPGLDLELTMFAGDFAFTKHHTMPSFGISSSTPNSHHASSAPTSPKRAETYPSTIEGLSVARSKKRINDLLSRFDPGTTPPSPESGGELSDTRSVAQSSQVNPITESDEWPVPTFFLDQIDPTPPKLAHADNLTPEDLGGSPKSFGNIQSKYIEDNETNDYYSMAEDVDSVPLLNSPFRSKPGPYSKVTHSDSGIGSTTMSYRQGPQSNMGSSYRYALSKKGGRSSRGSQAKGSVVFDNASVSASTTAAIYQQVAAKYGPLTSAASSTAGSIETPRMLSETALKTMKTIILEPILNDSKFRDFWDICKMAGEQMESGRIGSLRDLEKFLYHKASNIKNNQAYNNFCKEFLNHVRESLKYMPQNELQRPYDRPYDNDYFLDTLAPFVKSTGTMQSTVLEFSQGEEDPAIERWLDSMTSQPSQPEKRVAEAGPIHGSYAKRHKPSRPELIISTADTQSYPNNGYDDLSALSDSKIMTPMSGIPGLMCPPTFPQSKITHPRNKTRHRDKAQQVKEQQTFPCLWPDCPHPPFARLCDLTKHDKTHTRPHKCIVANCKYATEGFPTEKERDRHWADKHSSEMPNFPCRYPPCTYKSRRESNCKQHMEKAHGYTYVRMKQNYRTNGAKRQSNSPTSPGDQGNPMGRSSPNQQHFAAQPSTMTPQYQTPAFQHSMNNGFSQTRPQYSERDLATLEKMISSMVGGNTGSQDTFMLGGNQEHTNTPNSFGHQGYMLHGPTEQLPYPDAVDPRFLDFTPMPSMPDENIDPSLMNSKWMGG